MCFGRNKPLQGEGKVTHRSTRSMESNNFYLSTKPMQNFFFIKAQVSDRELERPEEDFPEMLKRVEKAGFASASETSTFHHRLRLQARREEDRCRCRLQGQAALIRSNDSCKALGRRILSSCRTQWHHVEAEIRSISIYPVLFEEPPAD